MSSLLAGPGLRDGMERYTAHTTRLGQLPGASDVVDTLERSGLLGRGGAGFPAATKWRAVAAQPGRAKVVLVNGAEGEPLSSKDRVLMEHRPHLVLDGAALAAHAVGANRVVLYIGEDHAASRSALERALLERPADGRLRTVVVSAPARYVAGEESAAVNRVTSGTALPTTTPPRPFVSGVDGQPTLVQNVETLAHAAMIARFGDSWYRSLGVTSPGTVLLTVSGAVTSPGVVEVAHGATVAEAVTAAGGLSTPASAVLVGGYFGRWATAADAWNLGLDATRLRAEGLTLGCGVVAVLPEARCGVVETARILGYLAEQSARQCGPCVFGLRAMAEAAQRVAAMGGEAGDLERLRRWAGQLRGRGACHHPDGAAGLLDSALRAFEGEYAAHHEHRRCGAGVARALAAA